MNQKAYKREGKLRLSIFVAIFLFSSVFSQSLYASTAHLDVQKALKDVISTSKKVERTIKKRGIKKLHSELNNLHIKLADLNQLMDQAMLNGKWKSASIKIEARKLIDRMESIKTLCFIGVAFTSDYYQYPDKYIPNSVKDAFSKMNGQLNTLNTEVETLNQLANKQA